MTETELLKTIEALKDRIVKLRETLDEVLRNEIVKCPDCKRGTRKKNTPVLVIKFTEEEPGYPVHYRDYTEIFAVCPKCNKKRPLTYSEMKYYDTSN